MRVATSDATEQTVTLGRGAVRISSREFLMELTQVRHVGRVRMQSEKVSRGDIFSRLPPHQREIFERMRRGLDEEEVKPAPKKAAAPAKKQPSQNPAAKKNPSPGKSKQTASRRRNG